MTAIPGTRTPRAVDSGGWRLRGRMRKSLLLVHIAASGAWLGIDVVLGVLVLAVVTPGDPQGAAVALASIGMFAVWPMLAMGLVSLASGVVLGLGSKYGLVRFWWVAVKLVLNIVLVSLVLLALRPGVAALAEQARGALSTGTTPPSPGDLVFPPVVSTTALLVAMGLSVFKPLGRIRRRPGRQPSS